LLFEGFSACIWKPETYFEAIAIDLIESYFLMDLILFMVDPFRLFILKVQDKPRNPENFLISSIVLVMGGWWSKMIDKFLRSNVQPP
jgi:hypothetical protein